MNQISKLPDFDDPNFDPFAADEEAFGDITDAYERLSELRKRGPVLEGDIFSLMGLAPDASYSQFKQFTIVGYDEVAEAQSDPAIYSNDAYLNSIGMTFGNSLSIMNPPHHSRYRRIFQHAFLPGIVNTWSAKIVGPVINGLIDKFADRGHADLVNEFAILYPFSIIYRQLELPQEDIATFHKLAVSQTLTINATLPYAKEAARKLGVYFQDMIDDKRRRNQKGEGLVDVLVNAEVDGEHLPDDVIVSFLRQLVNAAGDTTYRGTGTLFTGLLTNPDQYQAVYNDRELVPQGIEEALRWDAPSIMAYRTAARDVTLGGVNIPKDATLCVIVGAANRDPKVFPEPDKFDIFRKRIRHYAFGFGPHVCIGQHLARLEMTRAINAVMDRLPNLRLDPDKPPPIVSGGVMRTPRSVFVRFR